MQPEVISLSPKAMFCGDKAAASAHSDIMASPPFKIAAQSALLAYQYTVLGGDPAVLAISAAKVRGAQEFLRVLMNIGLPEAPASHSAESGLIPPEEALARPYEPPTK